jgi:hypothetical protein
MGIRQVPTVPCEQVVRSAQGRSGQVGRIGSHRGRQCTRRHECGRHRLDLGGDSDDLNLLKDLDPRLRHSGITQHGFARDLLGGDAVANAEILDLIQNSKFKIDHSKFRSLCAALGGEAVFL